jgi:hypothetical protein
MKGEGADLGGRNGIFGRGSCLAGMGAEMVNLLAHIDYTTLAIL